MEDLQKWVQQNPTLSELLVEIQEMPLTLEEQAKVAFERIPELLNIPRMPTDMGDYYTDDQEGEEGDSPEQNCVFAEFTLLKYLLPHEDPRGLVLRSCFNVCHNLQSDYTEAAKKHYGENLPKSYTIGLKGEGTEGEIVFPDDTPGKGWYAQGCIMAMKFHG